MAARILPFKRPAPKETPTIPPPMVTHYTDRWGASVSLLGTKEQLIAWGAAEERHFPVKPKRMAYNGGGQPNVRVLKGGKLFEVSWHPSLNEVEQSHRVVALTRRVLDASTGPCRSTTNLLSLIYAWRSQMIESRIDGYENGLLDPLDRALGTFREAACAMVMYRAEPEVVSLETASSERLPPDETEPEHAQ